MGWREEASSRAKEKKAGANYTMDVGDNTFRILPNKKGPKEKPYAEFRIHRDVGPEKVWVKCGKDVAGEGSCWLCDKLLPQLEESSSESKRAMAKAMHAQDVLILQVSPLDSNGKFMTPKPWWAPYSGGKSLGVAILTRLGDVRRTAIDDPLKGRNLTVERTGQGLKTRYGTLLLDETASAVPKAIIAQMKSLEEYEPDYNPKRQVAAWKGEKFEDEGNTTEGDTDDDTVAEGTDGEEGYELDEPAVEGEEEEVAEEGAEEELPADDDIPADDDEIMLDDDLGEEELVEEEPEPEPEPAPRRAARPAAPARVAAPARSTPARAPAPAPPKRTPAKAAPAPVRKGKR